MRSPVVMALAAALLASKVQAAAPADDLAAAKPAIDAANADWIPAMKAKDPRRIAEPYAADAVSIGADGSVTQGREALQASLSARFASMGEVIGGAIAQDDVKSVQPGLIYEWGHGAVEVRAANGEKRSGGGRYLSVWRRGDDGVWRISRNLSFAY
ncbi:YybH family protein [Caulobacter sp. NIBR2454]|uniref:YybH family protein n=1 Tax=Caulobacter sp. NIBR2454 TaxID=3015996 RepID=UPI0022B7392F|nr:SgcJ/EcaC family oxidoreductase [Caulobacter sp. NIBR2454]